MRLRLVVQLLSLCGEGAMRDAAGAELAAMRDSFTEGFDTPDLRDAGALIGRGGSVP